MAPTVPVGEPATLRAGTTWAWTQSFADFPPADGWAVTYYATGPTSFSVTTTPQSEDYLAGETAANTAAIAEGVYTWEARASLAGAIYVAATGVWSVTATTQVTAASDQRTHAQLMLAQIEAEIEARITGTGSAHESYANGDQSITKLSLAELRKLRVAYSFEVQRQQNNGTLPGYEVTLARP